MMSSKTAVTKAQTSECSEALLFVVRRAFRFGEVRRKDLVEAFGFSNVTATRVLQAALDGYPGHLTRTGYRVVPRPDTSAPAPAGEADLLQAMEEGRCEFARIGLRKHEFPVRYGRTRTAGPIKEGTLLQVQRAIVRQQAMRIRHVGMKAGEIARWVSVVPLALERSCLGWRVLAQDLGLPGYPVRAFFLLRIFDFDFQARKPKDFYPRDPAGCQVPVRLRPEPKLTPDQARAVCHQLGLTDQVLYLDERLLYDVLSPFADIKPESDMVWPLVRAEYS